MREDVEVSENRKSEHRDGNREANWERIFDNIARKAVFDAFGVVLESEDEAWEANAREV